MPFFICPNCGNRELSGERTTGFSTRPKGCSKCGFGFLFELLDDYYPAPGTGFVVCDADRRILAAGQGVFELTGYRESDLLGREVMEALHLNGHGEDDPAAVAVEWGVRQLDKQLPLRTRAGVVKQVRADFFPAYDEDGGLLVALTPL